MSVFRTRNRLLTAKIETTSGTDATPTAAANAIRCEGARWQPNFDVIQTNEHTGSLDGADPIVGGGFARLEFGVLAKGPGTGGSAPEFGAALRACSMAETLLASAVAGTAQAGAASTITLAASGPSSTDNAYRGMPIRTTGGTGSGQTRVITGYVGSTKVATVHPAWATEPDATTTYSIDACALYAPASDGLETLTASLYDRPVSGANSGLSKLVGAAGTFSLALQNRGVGRFSFGFSGQIPANPADITTPTGEVFDDVTPPPFIGVTAYLGSVAAKFNAFGLDFGAAVSMADDPTAALGYDVAGVVGRRIVGRINPRRIDRATRDEFTVFTAGTERVIWLSYGSVAGNRLSILVPVARSIGAPDADVGGFVHDDVAFEAVGQDNGLFLCFW